MIRFMEPANIPGEREGPRNLARAATAIVQARSRTRVIRDELALAADIITELSGEDARPIAEGMSREELISRYRHAIALLDDAEDQLTG